MFDDRPRTLKLDDLYADKSQTDDSNAKISDFKGKKRGRKKANPATKAKHVDITLYPQVLRDIDEAVKDLQKRGIMMSRSRLLTVCFYKQKEHGFDDFKPY
jgi:hypothetical protein